MIDRMGGPANFRALVEEKRMERQFPFGETVLLTLEIFYPSIRLAQDCGAAARINRYYSYQADCFYRYVSEKLLGGALVEYRRAVRNGVPFRPYSAVMHYAVALNGECRLSTWTDRYTYTGGAHGSTLRVSDTWELQSGCYIELGRMFRGRTDVRRAVIGPLRQAARHRSREEPGLLFADYPARLEGYFNPRGFYLAPDALCLYYQPYEIGPGASGVVTFELPYAKLGARFIRPDCCV